MFINLCIKYLTNQIAKSNISKRDKSSLINFLRLTHEKLDESQQITFELQRDGVR